MQKNWYTIYTKAKSEKRVSSVLSKKKIENFVPFRIREVTTFRKTKILIEPLFESYIFARIEEVDIEKINAIDGVVNLLYWKGKPAVVKEEEIKVIKDFVNDFQRIDVEKIKVNEKSTTRVVDSSTYSITGNFLSIKNNMVKANLPSLGFSLVAKLDVENPFDTAVTFGEKNLILQS